MKKNALRIAATLASAICLAGCLQDGKDGAPGAPAPDAPEQYISTTNPVTGQITTVPIAAGDTTVIPVSANADNGGTVNININTGSGDIRPPPPVVVTNTVFVPAETPIEEPTAQP